MLRELAEGLWELEGDDIQFIGFPYQLRMTVVRLSDRSLWLHSPVQLTQQRLDAVLALGPIHYLVSPNKLHHLFLADWSKAVPTAKLYGPRDLIEKRGDLPFAAPLDDTPLDAWRATLDQVLVKGSFFMQEAVFLHRSSGTVILGDLIENHDPDHFNRLQRWVAKANHMLGETPINYRLSFTDRKVARECFQRILGWPVERVIPMHGKIIEDDAAARLHEVLSWAL